MEFKPVKVGVVGLRPYFIGGHDANNEVRNTINAFIYTYLSGLRDNKTVVGLTGLGLGVEQDFARICYDLNIDYYAYLPYVDQEQRWKYLPAEIIKEYNFLLKNALHTEIISDGNYSPHKNLVKTQKIIENADHIIWVQNKRTSTVNNLLLDLFKKESKTVYEIKI